MAVPPRSIPAMMRRTGRCYQVVPVNWAQRLDDGATQAGGVVQSRRSHATVESATANISGNAVRIRGWSSPVPACPTDTFQYSDSPVVRLRRVMRTDYLCAL